MSGDNGGGGLLCVGGLILCVCVCLMDEKGEIICDSLFFHPELYNFLLSIH